MVFWGHMVSPEAPRKEPRCDKVQLHQKYMSFLGLAGLLPTKFSLSSSSSTEKHICIKWILLWNEIRTTRNKVPQFWKRSLGSLRKDSVLRLASVQEETEAALCRNWWWKGRATESNHWTLSGQLLPKYGHLRPTSPVQACLHSFLHKPASSGPG